MISRGHSGRGRVVAAVAVTLVAAPLLSGCIAAAALPVLAAGGVVKSRGDGKPPRTGARVALPAETATAEAPPAGAPAPDPVPATVRETVFPDGTQVTVTNTIARRAPAGPTAAPAPAPADASDGERAVRLTTLAALPPPSGTATGASSHRDYAAFADFAAEQAALPVIGSERQSVMLANPDEMTAQTRSCSIQPAGVLIDLDPGAANVDVTKVRPADPGIAARLQSLRTDGVTIGWVSARTADQAGAIRRALQVSGLDPAGRDELVLLRFPEERKQTRRDDFAKTHCVVAIAGDERSDFDELFAYLRDPAAALPLDKLIGAGWFLVPPPLTAN